MYFTLVNNFDKSLTEKRKNLFPIKFEYIFASYFYELFS